MSFSGISSRSDPVNGTDHKVHYKGEAGNQGDETNNIRKNASDVVGKTVRAGITGAIFEGKAADRSLFKSDRIRLKTHKIKVSKCRNE